MREELNWNYKLLGNIYIFFTNLYVEIHHLCGIQTLFKRLEKVNKKDWRKKCFLKVLD